MIDDGGIEAVRSATLKSFAILDTAPETVFDDLAAEAAHAVRAPVALISLVDEARAWFKASFGTALRDVDRSVAFCDHAVRGSGLMIVADTTRDDRFAANPLVVAAPGIRFYAGAPLMASGGVAIGTICVLDYCARDGLSGAERGELTVLALRTMRCLEDRRLRLKHTARKVAA